MSTCSWAEVGLATCVEGFGIAGDGGRRLRSQYDTSVLEQKQNTINHSEPTLLPRMR